jgi:diadenosine tetraphosphate (Ap4A) HIT family hydrolase
MSVACPFCQVSPDRIIAAQTLAVALQDAYPVSPGHALIVPRRHLASLDGLTDEEAVAIWSLLRSVRSELDRTLRPDGYNVGVNDGTAAGQTVMHLHVHLIPRFAGDRTDPRGGVRWIFPDKADYWSRRD